MATSTEIFIRAFMVQRFCDTYNESAGHKNGELLNRTSQTSLLEGRKQNFSNRDIFGIKTRQFNVDFENNWLFRKTSVRDEKLRIGIIPTRKTDPNIFQIALKQDYIDAQYVKLPYSM